MDALFLSRLQFAWVIGWHILLPAFTVGTASYIALMEGLRLLTGREIYLRISVFWTRIFAVSFGMGVVSGIVMPFQFGTNWARFSDATANVLGPLLAYEGLTAFFLEATFLGVLLFGRRLVPAGMHFLAALMVAGGTVFSSFWIIAANSWMQTPAGYGIGADGRFFPAVWTQVIFNPSFPYRLAHTIVAFYITSALVVLGIGATLLRRNDCVAEARVTVKSGLVLLGLLVPLQIFIGDLHGLNTLAYQPAKLAGIEARWETAGPLPLTLFALPDRDGERNRAEINIPYLGSLILTHSWTGTIHGLKDWPSDQRPPVTVVFFSFRLMVGLGVLMLGLLAWSGILAVRRRLWTSPAFHRACQWSMPLGFIAVLAGWTTTEVGRQPWSVYGVLRTTDSVSPSLTGGDVAVSLLAYALAYLVIFPAGLRFIATIVRAGPGQPTDHAPVEAGRPEGPFLARHGEDS
jgi:cytochrome bd ubiquinol oxidase subunit I